MLTLYGYVGAALIVFAVAGLTDLLDGMTARMTEQRSSLGAWLDPMADKLLLLAALGLVGGAWFINRVQLGESEPGSPLLHRNHDYNLSTTAINHLFPGSEELHVVARTDEKGGIKRPEVMAAIERFHPDLIVPQYVDVYNRG